MDIPTAQLPTRYGNFVLKIFTDVGGTEHMVMVKGDPKDGCLVRLHSECATGDILGSLRCDCRDQLEQGLKKLSSLEFGMLLYLRQEGRGIGLLNKIRAYALQETGMDTLDANTHLGFAPDERSYKAATDILKYFNLKKVRLLTNNPTKIDALETAGITVASHIPLWTATNPHNEKYIATKRGRMGHI